MLLMLKVGGVSAVSWFLLMVVGMLLVCCFY
jgi:hypothetical protein